MRATGRLELGEIQTKTLLVEGKHIITNQLYCSEACSLKTLTNASLH